MDVTRSKSEYKHATNKYLDDSLGSNKTFNLSLHLSLECIKTTNRNNLFEKKLKCKIGVTFVDGGSTWQEISWLLINTSWQMISVHLYPGLGTMLIFWTWRGWGGRGVAPPMRVPSVGIRVGYDSINQIFYHVNQEPCKY